MDQAVPHILWGAIVKFRRPENLCGQRRPLDLRGDGVPAAKQLPKVGEFRVLHISQPLDVLNQVSLLFGNLCQRPGQSNLSLLFALAFPT